MRAWNPSQKQSDVVALNVQRYRPMYMCVLGAQLAPNIYCILQNAGDALER